MSVCIQHVHGCLQRPKEDIGSSRVGISGSYESMWVLGTELQSSMRAVHLTAELPLKQPGRFIYIL